LLHDVDPHSGGVDRREAAPLKGAGSGGVDGCSGCMNATAGASPSLLSTTIHDASKITDSSNQRP
jgi:hypothetical protein